jgi:transcriptional regulator with XRE-family HTH domain
MWNPRTINQLSRYFPPFFSILLSFQYRQRVRLPSQPAANLGLSHATVSRWLSGKDIPSTSSCRKLAEYSGVPLEKVLAIAGHLPRVAEAAASEWPEFREYAHQKYPDELDEDLITMIEDLIERRRARRYHAKGS